MYAQREYLLSNPTVANYDLYFKYEEVHQYPSSIAKPQKVGVVERQPQAPRYGATS